MAHPYNFPFPPYSTQLQLMHDMTQCMDKGGVGLFESPTGTGKTLSILCSTLSWLSNNPYVLEKEIASAVAQDKGQDDAGLTWLAEYDEKMELERANTQRERMQQQEAAVVQRLQHIKDTYPTDPKGKALKEKPLFRQHKRRRVDFLQKSKL